MKKNLALALVTAGVLAAPMHLAAQDAASAAVEKTLDAFHQAASEADGDTYFGLFTADGVFLGTDATERWTVEEFRAYAQPFFSRGQGWTYTALERHVSMAPGGDVAWFDERLINASLGETRGSGVLLREDGQWRVAQYNLTIPIPNELAGDVALRIRELTEGVDE
jgi:ketosteroid isomerase-like protein